MRIERCLFEYGMYVKHYEIDRIVIIVFMLHRPTRQRGEKSTVSLFRLFVVFLLDRIWNEVLYVETPKTLREVRQTKKVGHVLRACV